MTYMFLCRKSYRVICGTIIEFINKTAASVVKLFLINLKFAKLNFTKKSYATVEKFRFTLILKKMFLQELSSNAHQDCFILNCF